jgi:predicted secreted protein
VKTHDEAGIEKVPGQADSAPADFRPARLALRATVLAAVLCTLYVSNYIYGWITPETVNIFNPPK